MSDPGHEDALLAFFREVNAAVEASNAGGAPAPYRSGTFLVAARAGDVELTIKDVSEEDAVLIAGELRALGARAVIRGSVRCPACGRTVPDQAFCSSCRARLRPALPSSSSRDDARREDDDRTGRADGTDGDDDDTDD